MSRRGLIILLVVGALALMGGVAAIVAATSGSSDELVVYTARSHYGEEEPFKQFASKEGVELTLFGGDASGLYERLETEKSDPKADVLITVDAANLWRAEQAGLLEKIESPQLDRNVPANLRDPDGEWFGLTVRARTIMRSKDRVSPAAVTTYEGLGDPRWKDKLCLRSGTSDYNVSFVADRIAKEGEAKTKRMLERWMANDPRILGSDTDVLKAIAAGRCDVGLTNSYYLGRELEDDPSFPVAPVWADQKGRGTHLNLSGIGVVKGANREAEAKKLVAFLTSPSEQQVFANNNHEFGVDPQVKTTKEIAQFGSFKRDPIDVAGAGEHLGDAVRMMNQVGWD
jgi:iron(III) transport system substrate-binding protein